MHIDRIVRVVADMFAKYPAEGRPDTILFRLLEYTLKRNDFKFGNSFFLQILGMALGKRNAPSCANLYLVEFNKAVREDYFIRPLHYYRF